jgi:nucleotide-binding universal stress UspA family protein
MMFEQVLVGVDGHPGGRDAIALARQLAAPGARTLLANMYGGGGMLGRGGGLAIAAERSDAQSMLTRERRAAGVEAETVVSFGRPGKGLRELAEDERADLLVVGSSHRGVVGRVLLGNDSIAALNGASCAVAIAPRGYTTARHQVTTIGVGHDGSVEADLAMRAARAVAARYGSTIRLRAVITAQDVSPEPPIPLDWTAETESALERERRRLRAIEGVESDAVYGDPGEQLAALSHQVDLMVVGSRSQAPLGRMMNGSTSNYLARRVHCPLLVLPRALTHSVPASPAEPY